MTTSPMQIQSTSNHLYNWSELNWMHIETKLRRMRIKYEIVQFASMHIWCAVWKGLYMVVKAIKNLPQKIVLIASPTTSFPVMGCFQIRGWTKFSLLSLIMCSLDQRSRFSWLSDATTSFSKMKAVCSRIKGAYRNRYTYSHWLL